MYLQQCYSSIISSPLYHPFYKQVQRQLPPTAVSILPCSKQISNSVNLCETLLTLIYVELKEYGNYAQTVHTFHYDYNHWHPPTLHKIFSASPEITNITLPPLKKKKKKKKLTLNLSGSENLSKVTEFIHTRCIILYNY
jgi:hypothetical protein